ncbi:MAG: SGNH/GDSL hydrolase family protein [Verrucomicrobia bacterium]|nr:SGNH/GDSL hydrolase family protein [Verrucomicrobiota bacterium]
MQNRNSSSSGDDILRSGRAIWLGKLGVLLFGLLAAFGLAEILTRMVAPHPRYPEFTVPDERVGYLPRPGERGRTTNMFGEFDTEIRINQEGFRDRDHPVVASSNTVRIAFLGDSFTYGEQVEEPQTFARRVETLLNADLSRGGGSAPRIETMNFGVGGYDTQQEALCYEAFVRKYRPNLLVLAMYVHNDLIGNAFYLLENGFGRPYFRLANGVLQKIPADRAKMEENHRETQRRLGVRWYHHLQFYNAQKQLQWEWRQQSKRRRLARNRPSLEEVWKEDGCRNYRYYAGDGRDPVVVEADALTRLLLERIAAMTREDGGRFCVALLPAEENLHPDRWTERVKLLPALEGMPMDFERSFQRIASFLPETVARGDLLDLRPSLRAASAARPIFFKRDNHYNAWGHEAVAQALAQWLQPRISDGK